jgi:hypothetical protein
MRGIDTEHNCEIGGAAEWIHDLLEDHAWVQTPDGCRLAAEYFQSSTRFVRTKSIQPSYLNAEYVKTLWRGQFGPCEDDLGMKVLQAKVTTNLRDSSGVQKDLSLRTITHLRRRKAQTRGLDTDLDSDYDSADSTDRGFESVYDGEYQTWATCHNRYR